MESLLKQKRVRFSSPDGEEPSKDGPPEERLVPTQQTKSFKMDNSAKNWFRSQFNRQMSQDYDAQESELAVSVAAAAFVVNSVEEAEVERRRKMKADTIGSVRVAKTLTGKEEKDSGEPSTRKPKERHPGEQEDALTSRKTSRSASFSARNPADQTQMGHSARSDVKETKAGSWEKAQLLKIRKRYEKIKSGIFSWENAKKMKARLHMERKKSELELRKTRNSQHYQDKIARFEMIARGEIAQLEDKRRREESEVKQKAKYMRTKGRTPVKCFCC